VKAEAAVAEAKKSATAAAMPADFFPTKFMMTSKFGLRANEWTDWTA